MRLGGIGARCESEVKPKAVFNPGLVFLEKHEGAAAMLIFVNVMKLLKQFYANEIFVKIDPISFFMSANQQ